MRLKQRLADLTRVNELKEFKIRLFQTGCVLDLSGGVMTRWSRHFLSKRLREVEANEPFHLNPPSKSVSFAACPTSRSGCIKSEKKEKKHNKKW